MIPIQSEGSMNVVEIFRSGPRGLIISPPTFGSGREKAGTHNEFVYSPGYVPGGKV